MRAIVLNTLVDIQMEDAWSPDRYWTSAVEGFIFRKLKSSFLISHQLDIAELQENFRRMPRVINRYRKCWSGPYLSRRSAGKTRAV